MFPSLRVGSGNRSGSSSNRSSGSSRRSSIISSRRGCGDGRRGRIVDGGEEEKDVITLKNSLYGMGGISNYCSKFGLSFLKFVCLIFAF